DEVGDEVVAAVELDVDLGPGVLDAVPERDEAVVEDDQGDADHHDEGDDDDGDEHGIEVSDALGCDPVMVRIDPVRVPPIGFAHRGARAHAPENTLEAFALGLKLGATGLESDAWLTADGHVAPAHDGVAGRRPRRRPIPPVPRAGRPAHVPTLEDLYDACGSAFELSLDVKDPAAARPIVEVARARGAADRLWLCHHDWR